MQQIKLKTEVMVLTGYQDSQLHYQGFEATVVATDGDHITVRDRQGNIHECSHHELTPLDTNGTH